tara:strand:- start:6979 stop:8877 length:1899 start_codon:yes stop_codon:yes gene_type:complete
VDSPLWVKKEKKMYSNSTIQRAVPIYAQHLAETTGVKVVVNGAGAFTDGKVVNIPFIRDGDANLAFGFLSHECSHVRNTEMSVFHKAAATPMRKRLLNVLEDIRIERLSMDQYPGTEEDIRYLNRKVLLEPFVAESVEQASPTHVFHNAILYGTYWLVQEPQLEEPAKAYMAALSQLVGSDVCDLMFDIAKQCKECENTLEVLGLVDQIIALLPSKPPESDDSSEPEGEDDDQQQNGGASAEPDDSSEPEGEDDDQQQNGGASAEPDDSSEPEGEGDDQQQNGGASAEPDNSSEPEGEDDDQQQSGGASAEPDDSSEPDDEDDDDQSADCGAGNGINIQAAVQQATEEDLKDLISDIGNAAGELLNRELRDKGSRNAFTCRARSGYRNDTLSGSTVMIGTEASAGLRQVMNGLIQGQLNSRVRLKRQGMKIDTGRIAMLKAGETRVFRSKTEAVRQTAAVQFLLDKSGSMQQSMRQAEGAVYAVLKSLEGIPNVSTGAMAFPERDTSCALIKAHGERLNAAVQAGGFGALHQGLTPLGEAMWAAAEALVAPKTVKTDRKILFVITDGQPDDIGYAMQMVELCERSGIEVLGLGFGNATETTLRQVFKKYEVVGSVANLRTALFGAVRNKLTN